MKTSFGFQNLIAGFEPTSADHGWAGGDGRVGRRVGVEVDEERRRAVWNQTS